MEQKYKSINGMCPSSKVEEVGERIKELMKQKKGEITPYDILEEARIKKSPLHDLFDWKDEEAAKKWRMHQARLILNGIVEVVVVEGKQHECRSFFNVKNTKKERVYVTLDTATNNNSYTHQLLEDAEGYIQHFLHIIKILKGKIN